MQSRFEGDVYHYYPGGNHNHARLFMCYTNLCDRFARELRHLDGRPFRIGTSKLRGVLDGLGVVGDVAIVGGLVLNALFPWLGPLLGLAKGFVHVIAHHAAELGHIILSLANIGKEWLHHKSAAHKVNIIINAYEHRIRTILRENHLLCAFAYFHAYTVVVTHAQMLQYVHEDSLGMMFDRLAQRFVDHVFSGDIHVSTVEKPDRFARKDIKLVTGDAASMNQLFSYSLVEVNDESKNPPETHYYRHDEWEFASGIMTGRRVVAPALMLDRLESDSSEKVLKAFSANTALSKVYSPMFELKQDGMRKMDSAIFKDFATFSAVVREKAGDKAKNKPEKIPMDQYQCELPAKVMCAKSADELMTIFASCFGDENQRKKEIYDLVTEGWQGFIFWRYYNFLGDAYKSMLMGQVKRFFIRDTLTERCEAYQSLVTIAKLNRLKVDANETRSLIALRPYIEHNHAKHLAVAKEILLLERILSGLLSSESQDESVVVVSEGEPAPASQKQKEELLTRKGVIEMTCHEHDLPAYPFDDPKKDALHWFFQAAAYDFDHSKTQSQYYFFMRWLTKGDFNIVDNLVLPVQDSQGQLREDYYDWIISTLLQQLLDDFCVEIICPLIDFSPWFAIWKNKSFIDEYNEQAQNVLQSVETRLSQHHYYFYHFLTTEDFSQDYQQMYRQHIDHLQNLFAQKFAVMGRELALSDVGSRNDCIQRCVDKKASLVTHVEELEEKNTGGVLKCLFSAKDDQGYHPRELIRPLYNHRSPIGRLPLPPTFVAMAIKKGSHGLARNAALNAQAQLLTTMRHYFHLLSVNDTHPLLDWTLLMICAQFHQQKMVQYLLPLTPDDLKGKTDHFGLTAQKHSQFFATRAHVSSAQSSEVRSETEDWYTMHYVKRVLSQMLENRRGSVQQEMVKYFKGLECQNMDKVKKWLPHFLTEEGSASMRQAEQDVMLALKGDCYLFEQKLKGEVSYDLPELSAPPASEPLPQHSGPNNNNQPFEADVAQDQETINNEKKRKQDAESEGAKSVLTVQARVKNDANYRAIRSNIKYIFAHHREFYKWEPKAQSDQRYQEAYDIRESLQHQVAKLKGK